MPKKNKRSKDEYLRRCAERKKLLDKKRRVRQSKAPKHGVEFVSSLDDAKKAEIVAHMKAQGASDYEIQSALEAPCKFLASKRKKL